MNTFVLFLRTMRPSQWVKNLFVVAPVLFAKSHTAQDPAIILRALAAALVFALLSGSVYVMNDILDADRDSLHPVKKNRPIASGDLDVRTAVSGGLAALALALLCGYFLGGAFNLAAIAYLALNVAYSWYLKNVPWLELAVIAIGFILRIAAGSLAIGLMPSEISYYLILCTFLVALFLALGKRRHELAAMGAGDTRAVLDSYRPRQLDAALLVVAVVTGVAYAMYTISSRTRDYFGTDSLVYTIPFVFLGIARFVFLLKRSKDARSPTDSMLRDAPFVINTLAWVTVVIWVIYFQPTGI